MNPFATGIFDAAPLDLPSAKEQGDWLDHRSNSWSLIEGLGFYAFLVFLAMLLGHTLRPKDATALRRFYGNYAQAPHPFQDIPTRLGTIGAEAQTGQIDLSWKAKR